MIPLDVSRCNGRGCPSANHCARYLERHVPKGCEARYAAFDSRREAGADACDSIIPVMRLSTFDASERVAGTASA